MAQQAQFAKVFRIEMNGGTEVQNDILKIKKVMQETGAAIRAAKKELASLLTSKVETGAVDELTKKISQLEKQLASLKVERKTAETDAKRQAQAEKILADAKLNTAKADKIAADASRTRVKSQIDQEKELDRQIALEQKQQSQAEKTRRSNAGVAGSYNDIKKALAELRPFVQSGGVGGTTDFRGQNLNFEQAIAKFKELSFAEQGFRRQFAADGTIVGEYAKGIVNAFSRLGIDDIIKSQIGGAKKQLSDLEAKTRELVDAYRAAQQQGTQDLNKLEKEIHDNVVETQKLEGSIKSAETQLKGVGGVGTQITSSISNGFKQLKNDLGGFILGFVGFQAAMRGISDTFDTTKKIDSLNASMKVVSGTQVELAKNQQFLSKTTDQLGLEYTSAGVAFKNFFAAGTQAGLTADQTRQIYFNAAQAASNLKLSQEDVNGVLLAFGQIASKGKVQAEELRGQIGERIPGAFAIAARAIGKTQAELNKMLENGEVIASDFLPKFAKELGKTFGGDSTKRIDGLQASVNRLKNEFTQLIQNNQAGLAGFFSLLINAIGLLIKSLPVLITLGTLLLVNWAAQNSALLLLRAQLLGYNIAIGANYVALGLLSVAQAGYNAILFVTNGALTLVTRGLALFGVTLRATSGPLGIILTVVGLLGAAYIAFGKSLDAAKSSINENNRLLKAQAEVQRASAKAIAEETGELNKWYKVAVNANVPLKDRQTAIQSLIDKFPEYFGNLNKETASVKQLTEAYDAATIAIRNKAFAQASAELAAKAQAKVNEVAATQLILSTEFATGSGSTRIVRELTDEQEALLEQVEDKLGDKGSLRVALGVASFFERDFAAIQRVLDQIRIEREKTTAAFDKVAAQYNTDDSATSGKAFSVFERFKQLVDNNGTEDEFEALLKDVKTQKGKVGIFGKEFKELKKLQEEIENLLNPKNKKGRENKERKDAFRDIDAIRDKLNARDEQYRSEGLTGEKVYLENILANNVDALNKKLAILKGKNAEERKLISQFNLEKVKLTKETNEKLFAIENKEIENELRDQQIQAASRLQSLQLNPELSNEGRARAKQDSLNTELSAQIVFNQKQIALEKQYGIDSIDNAQKRKEAIEQINLELANSNREIFAAQAKDIEAAADDLETEIKKNAAQRTINALNSNLSPRKQAAAIVKAEQDAADLILANTAARLKREVELYRAAAALKLASESEYQQKLAAYKTAEAALLQRNYDKELTLIQRFKNAIKDIGASFKEVVLGIKTYSADAAGQQQKANDAIADTLGNVQKAIKTAYDNYFRAEENRIEHDRELQQGFLDREKERVLAKAQGEAERATIERQFEKKREQLEKETAEKRKKLALKQAAIEFAVAAIKTYATYGWPFGLVAVAGLAAAYFAQRASIQQQQFAKGGQVKAIPIGNGKINKGANIPAQRNGDNVLATVRTGEVILNHHQQRALGGAKTFKRIGVPGFATGGAVFGSDVQAPTFSASTFLNGGVSQQANDSGKQMEEIRNMLAETIAAVNATDRKPVVLNPHAVTKAQEQRAKDEIVVKI